MKQGEIDYLQAIGDDGRAHAMGKPFSDPECWRYLMALGQIMQLLMLGLKYRNGLVVLRKSGSVAPTQ